MISWHRWTSLSPGLLSLIWGRSTRRGWSRAPTECIPHRVNKRVAGEGRTGSLSSVFAKSVGFYLATAPIFTSKVCQSALGGNASLPNLTDPFKLTISDIYNRSQQPPSAAYYHHPLPHLLFLWRLNWLTVFALVIGCLLDRLMPPVGLPGQTGRQRGKRGGGCVTITVIRMQSLLKLKHPAAIIHFSPGGRWEH